MILLDYILTLPLVDMFFSSGKCSLVRSRKDASPFFLTIAMKYKLLISVLFHFKSGSNTNPVSGSASLYITRSFSLFPSSIL